ncbi:MAG: hypothetical protein NUK57_12650, partial [Gudongella sp.]|nr:hypothetical protein [Gudongella sp.]
RALKIRIESLEYEMDIQLEKATLLQKYKLADKYQLYKLLERARVEETKAEQDKSILAELQGSRESISAKMKSHNTELLAMKRMLGEILSNNQVGDMQAFHEGLQKKSRLKEIKREIEFNQETIKRILKDENLVELKLLYDERPDAGSDTVSNDMAAIFQSHDKLHDKRRDLLLKINQIEGSLSQLEYSIDQELSLNEKLKGLRTKEASLRIRRESLEMAKTRIKALSSDIHREFAPSLNKRVGQFICRLTEGRYSDVKVDKNLNFNLIQEGTNRLIPLEYLSGGTLDQMYIGLRLGIVDELISNSLPIFLDECFSQYDDQRLGRILEFMTTFENRQVVLFTCQAREEEMLKSTGKKYNKINLQYS